MTRTEEIKIIDELDRELLAVFHTMSLEGKQRLIGRAQEMAPRFFEREAKVISFDQRKEKKNGRIAR